MLKSILAPFSTAQSLQAGSRAHILPSVSSLRLQMRRSGAASCVSLGPALEGLTDYEMDAITRVFRSFETGLRQATILPKVGSNFCKLENIYYFHQDLVDAMKMLGLNPMEQEVIDLTNNNVKNGFIYFPEFCSIIHQKYREDNQEVFYQDMFKVKMY